MHLESFCKLESKYNKYILFILLFFNFFLSLNALPPLDRDESRYLQSTKQMIETSDYINIKFLDTARVKKPPGIYWLQAGTVQIVKEIFFLEKIPVWVYRLPSAIGATIAVWLTLLIGKTLFNKRVGFIAALLLMSTPLIIVESHIAKTDSVLLACVLFPLLALAKIISASDLKEKLISDSFLYWAWFILGISLLIKGPIGLLIVFLTIISLKLSKINFKFSDLKIRKGVYYFFLGSLPCFIWLYHVDTSHFVQQSIVNDMLMKVIKGQESHGAYPGFYLITSLLSCWPISLFLIPLFLWVYKNIRDKKIVFLLSWLVPAWIIFEFIPTKLSHYILPLIPSLSILTAAMIVDIKKNDFYFLKNRFYKALLYFFSLTPIILGGLILYIDQRFFGNNSAYSLIVALIFFITFITSLYFLFKNNYLFSGILHSFTNIVCLSIMLIFIFPNLKFLWVSEQIYEYVSKHKIQRSVVLMGYSEPSAVFRLGSDTYIANNVDEAFARMKNGKKNLLIIESKFEKEFLEKEKLNNLILFKHNKIIKGLNYSKGKNVLLSIYSN